MHSCPIISRSLAHSSGNSFLLTALSCHRIFTVSNIGNFRIIQIFPQSFLTYLSVIGDFLHISIISPSFFVLSSISLGDFFLFVIFTQFLAIPLLVIGVIFDDYQYFNQYLLQQKKSYLYNIKAGSLAIRPPAC